MKNVSLNYPKNIHHTYLEILYWSLHRRNSTRSHHKNKTREKKITTNSKNELEESYNLKTFRDDVVFTLFSTNISDFSGNSEGILDEGMYKRTI